MSKLLNTKDSYNRINRNELLIDSNTTKTGSLSETISNPIQLDNKAILINRIGDINDFKRDLLPGYCLRFDYNNPDSYIQTEIPSNLIGQYEIFIRGEGNTDILYIDSSSDNIAFRQKSNITTSDNFLLSYIAFKNKTSNEIEHLFECEESDGLSLYDSVTGNIAKLENVASLSSMRVTSKSKEYIKDINRDVNHAIKFNSGSYAVVENTGMEYFTLPLSFCMDLYITEEDFNNFAESNSYIFTNNGILWTSPWQNFGMFINFYKSGTQKRILFCLNKKNSTPLLDRFQIAFDITTFGRLNIVFTIGDTFTATQSDGRGYFGPYKIFVNGEKVKSTVSYSQLTNDNKFETEKHIIIHANTVYGNTTSPATTSLAYTIRKMLWVNYDMSSENAPYTIEDYYNDIELNSTNGLIYKTDNISKIDPYLLDYSSNNYNASITGDVEYINKNYGTWCNAVGYNKITMLLGPDNWNKVSSYPYMIWDNNYFASVSNSGKDVIFTKTGNNVANFYSSVICFGFNSSSANTRFKAKSIIFEGDDIFYTLGGTKYIPSSLTMQVFQELADGSTPQLNVSQNSYAGGKFRIQADLSDDVVLVRGYRISVNIPYANRQTLSAGDTLTLTNGRSYVTEFVNSTIPDSALSSMYTINLPRKVEG